MYSLSDYDYSYPENLIAKYPLENRDQSKMMVLDRANQTFSHHHFFDFPKFFKKGDVLVVNDSKVFPARVFAKKKTGGKVECLFLREAEEGIWEVLLRPFHKIKVGDELSIFPSPLVGEGSGAGTNPILKLTILESEGSVKKVRINPPQPPLIRGVPKAGDLYKILEKIGEVPLPPYLKREAERSDDHRYQTVYAQNAGSVAAPTAGFHFTDKILKELDSIGVIRTPVTLHVGAGTFLPIRAENITEHKMHGEYYHLSNQSVEIITQAKKEGRRITVVGTTATRALESACDENGNLKAGSGYTEKFIYPPYEFKIVDRLLTNFHQPQSTLLVLVSALAGRELISKAYKEAVNQQYRLFSYGDCMLIA